MTRPHARSEAIAYQASDAAAHSESCKYILKAAKEASRKSYRLYLKCEDDVDDATKTLHASEDVTFALSNAYRAMEILEDILEAMEKIDEQT